VEQLSEKTCWTIWSTDVCIPVADWFTGDGVAVQPPGGVAVY
jgi:hypothetical protein